MYLDERGVASAELLFVTLISLIIMGSFIGLISTEMNNAQTGELGKARILGERIAETINTVYINGNGYSVNLTLPNDFNYTVYVNSTGHVKVNYNNQNITVKLISKNNIENITMNSGEKYHVKNTNGTVRFTLI